MQTPLIVVFLVLAVSLISLPEPAKASDRTVAQQATRAAKAPVRITAAPRSQIVRASTQASNLGFQRWLDGFRVRARKKGVKTATLNAGLAGIQYNSNVISNDRNQSEFTKQLWEYLDSAVSTARINNGRSALKRHYNALQQIEKKYGVPKEVVVAIWGLESAYGGYRGNTPTIEALATLAYDGRRGQFFEEQLIGALKIIQAGDVTPRRMIGSWAGAMGHTQFIPTSYLSYAVDFTGDGRRDIWSDDPTDALASTAAYLAKHGWKKGRVWGVEVQLPAGFDYGQTGHTTSKSPKQWSKLGVRTMAGQTPPNHGKASILVPGGARGPALMIYKNFNVIETYNAADSYVIAVGMLSDRIAGKPALSASWPRGDKSLLVSEKKELQRRLTAAGFSTGGIDGKIGPNTIEAIRKYQRSAGMVADGYASKDLLSRLR